ncbi:MAG: two-component system sensor histidine kinase CbrA [Gammaproteobacteria bacterium]|nr:MAG: two-component system sensor histidine kinase CbrA [Gammaproteobacteria bacterium]
MTFELGHLFFAAVVYLLILFFIAYATEQGWIPQRVARHPATYALSLGVYATSWTFYGSVGFAQTQGFNFLSIYIGVTLAFMLAPVLLAPILRIAREYQLSSLADVLSFRYRSQTAGVLVTLLMLVGAFPYIALQILAVTESIRILTQQATPWVLALGFCVTLTLFAILFGARHISPREKHEGLVVAIAFESVVKLVALGAVGVFAVFGVFGGFGGLDDWLAVNPEALEALYRPVREGPWTTLLLLSFSAAFLLPRQFHMAFAENIDERTLWSASWMFPLFLLLLNLFIPAILWAGTELGATTNADFYVLGITLAGEYRALTALAFIGGISAASAMMIVTTLALASMCLNHLLLPASYPDPDVNLYKWLLWGRRTLIAVIILTGYGFYLVLERNQGLVQLGLISFVAVAQLLPGVFGLLFWPRATRAGFIAGLLGGGAMWTLTLLFPLLESSGIGGSLLGMLSMPAGPDQDPWSYSTLSSLTVNGLLFFSVSLLTRPSEEEREAADACCRTTFALPDGAILTASSPGEFKQRLARILGDEAASFEVDQALRDVGMDYEERGSRALRQLRERIERNLSGLMGPMLARMIVDERLQTDSGARTALADNIRFIEERIEHSQMRFEGAAAELDRLRRYHQQTLRDLPLGVCALGPDRQVLTWNLAMEVISGVDRGQSRGLTVDQLPAPWSDLMRRCVDGSEQHLHKVETAINGRRRWFNLHKAAIEDPTAPGEAGGVVILVEDLTDLQNLESELAHSERLASIGRLAAGVAHEIGNPVTGIACLAQNLESETEDGDVRATSRQIIEQTRRVSEIVQTLVGFSHGGSFASERPQMLALADCIREAADLVRLSHGARQVDIRIDCPQAILLTADRTRLIQVFVNLLTNACDASRPGDKVTVRAQLDSGNGIVEVIDSGEGMAQDLLDQVFEPFVTTKAPRHGTGLGLSVVYRIVQDHGGQIHIDSRPGHGTRVLLTLPGAELAGDLPRQASEASPGGLS